MSGREAIVAGAGIAGLAAALALSKAGWRVRILERAARLEAVGAGLQLSPNALDVLEQLGLLAALMQAGVAATHVTLRAARSGRALARVPVTSADGRGYLALHRADLQSVLAEAVLSAPSITLDLGAALVSVEENDDSVRVGVERSDGARETLEGPLLVAADGVRSMVARCQGFPDPELSGAIALRIMGREAVQPGEGIEAWLGPRRHAVRYPVRPNGDRNLVLIVPEDDPGLDAFRGWDPRLQAMIADGAPLGSWPLTTVAPRWRARPGSRIVHLGDAAHAMLPYAAQGAAMAIEDAWILAASLSGVADLETGLKRYEGLRRPRIARVLERVAFHRRTYHLPFPLSLGRDAVLAVRSPASLRRDLGWLYDWRAPDLDRPA